MTREDIRAKFRAADAMFRKYKFNTSPIYLEFLQGKREMTCTAWGNPTRNIKGWKGPCYLITDIHHKTFDDLLNKTPWEKYGYGKDPRCENCMVHVGYEPSAALGVNGQLGDSWKMLKWQLAAGRGHAPDCADGRMITLVTGATGFVGAPSRAPALERGERSVCWSDRPARSRHRGSALRSPRRFPRRGPRSGRDARCPSGLPHRRRLPAVGARTAAKYASNVTGLGTCCHAVRAGAGAVRLYEQGRDDSCPWRSFPDETRTLPRRGGRALQAVEVPGRERSARGRDAGTARRRRQSHHPGRARRLEAHANRQRILDFLRGRMPAYVETGLNVVPVEDVAKGHLLAAERGRTGERYILGGAT